LIALIVLITFSFLMLYRRVTDGQTDEYQVIACTHCPYSAHVCVVQKKVLLSCTEVAKTKILVFVGHRNLTWSLHN